MNLITADYFVAIIALSAFCAQVFFRPRAIRLAIIISIVAIAGIVAIAAYYSLVQYRIWSASDFSKFLLPPYRSISYFLFYVFMRFWVQYVTSFVIGFILGTSAYFFNKKFGGGFLEAEEPYLIFLAFFIVGHPFWLIYFAVFLGIAALAAIIARIFGHRQKMPLYYLWLPIALIVILLKQPLLHSPFFQFSIFYRLKF